MENAQNEQAPPVELPPVVLEPKAAPPADSIYSALARAQAKFPRIQKTKTATVKMDNGGAYTYNYADLGDILAVILPVLAAEGLAVTQPLIRGEESGKLYLVTRLHYGREMIESDGLLMPEGLKAQQFGAILSYWRRYDFCSLLAIAPEDDVDGAPEPGDLPTNGFDRRPAAARPNRGAKPPARPAPPAAPVPANLRQEAKPAPVSAAITPAERQALLEFAAECNVSVTDFKRYCHEQFGLDSTAAMTPAQMVTARKWLESVRD